LFAALPFESVAADTARGRTILGVNPGGINMESAEILDAYFALATTYQNLFAAYRKRGINRNLNPNDQELIDRSDGSIQRYYTVGTDAMRVIVNALLANSRQPPQSILDFPSGSGRVTRHLRAFFPEARIVASDLYDNHLTFCRQAFQIDCLLSRVNISEIDFGEKFDLIFCGSLLSHLPEASFLDTINLLGRFLSDSGIALITLQGRFSDHVQATNPNFYLPDQNYEVAAEGVRRTGFGYVDYTHDVLKGLFNKEEGYGIALVRPHWVVRLLEPRTDLRLLGYVERGWDNHQDVLIFGRPGVNAGWGTQDTPACVKEPERQPGCPAPALNYPTTPASGTSERTPRMSPAAAEKYVASLFTTVLKRDPTPGEFANWVAAAATLPPEQVYFTFAESEEYKLQREKSVPTMFLPGHYYSPIVDPSTIAEYVEKQYLQEPGDLKGIHLDEDAMVRFWIGNAEFIKNTPFSEHDDGKNRYYYDNVQFGYGDAITLRAMIGYFKPKNVIEVGSGFSSACMLDAADHVGLADFAMTCIDPDADRLRSRLRQEDRSRVEIIEGPVQDVPVSTFSKLKENDILFIDSTHVLKTGSDVHYELFSILPSLNKGVLVHFHDIQYPFEYPREWLFEKNLSWNEIYALRAFLTYNSEFEVLFWNPLFAHRQRALIHETNPLFLKNPGGSIWLRARSADIRQKQHAQIGVIGSPQVRTR
jgi:hypothetical protein